MAGGWVTWSYYIILKIFFILFLFIADRGYALSKILMNPYRNPKTIEQKNTNIALKQVRTVMDKAVAILTARFGWV